ncbi:hypothetical protein Hanom_Chr13g01244571 [Helianthus anomalus]
MSRDACGFPCKKRFLIRGVEHPISFCWKILRLEFELKWHRSVEVFLLANRFSPSVVLGMRTLTIF